MSFIASRLSSELTCTAVVFDSYTDFYCFDEVRLLFLASINLDSPAIIRYAAAAYPNIVTVRDTSQQAVSNDFSARPNAFSIDGDNVGSLMLRT
jgi:hypothetical protein